MLGWHFSVYRQKSQRTRPTTQQTAEEADRIAVWQAGADGIDWIRKLVNEGRAIAYSDSTYGYPYRFTAMARDIVPYVTGSPPKARDVWASQPGDELSAAWAGQTRVDAKLVESLGPEEWLYIEVWDES